MIIYCIFGIEEHAQNDSYWLRASSEEEARLLVALNVEEASDARDATKYRCVPDSRKAPPRGYIYRRLYGPVAIAKLAANEVG